MTITQQIKKAYELKKIGAKKLEVYQKNSGIAFVYFFENHSILNVSKNGKDFISKKVSLDIGKKYASDYAKVALKTTIRPY